MRPFWRAVELIGLAVTAVPFGVWALVSYIRWNYNFFLWINIPQLIVDISILFIGLCLVIGIIAGTAYCFIETPLWWRIKQYIMTGRVKGKVKGHNLLGEYRWADEE